MPAVSPSCCPRNPQNFQIFSPNAPEFVVQLHHHPAPARTYTAARESQVFALYPTQNCFFKRHYRLWPGWTACKRVSVALKALLQGWLDLSSASFFVPKRTGSVLTLYIDEMISFPFSALIWIRVKNVRSCWNPASYFSFLSAFLPKRNCPCGLL